MPTAGPAKDTQASHPRARRHALVTLALVACAGLGIHFALDGLLADIEAEGVYDPDAALERLRPLVRWLALAMAGGTLVLAVALASIAHRTDRANRFPPPGLVMLRATRIVTGPAARRHALAVYVAAGVLAFGAVVFAWQIEAVIAALTG